MDGQKKEIDAKLQKMDEMKKKYNIETKIEVLCQKLTLNGGGESGTSTAPTSKLSQERMTLHGDPASADS